MAAGGAAAVGEDVAPLVDVETVFARRQVPDLAVDLDAVGPLRQVQLAHNFALSCNGAVSLIDHGRLHLRLIDTFSTSDPIIAHRSSFIIHQHQPPVSFNGTKCRFLCRLLVAFVNLVGTLTVPNTRQLSHWSGDCFYCFWRLPWRKTLALVNWLVSCWLATKATERATAATARNDFMADAGALSSTLADRVVDAGLFSSTFHPVAGRLSLLSLSLSLSIPSLVASVFP